jgi:membrane protease YdiL (CAAX protease family)
MEAPAEHIPLRQRAEQYWTLSREPLGSLIFILPLLAIYEAGVLWFGVRPSGADDLMRRLLDLFGFGQHFLLPGLTIALLLGWHYLSRAPWRVHPGVLPAMLVESIALGLCLRVIAFMQHSMAALDVTGPMGGLKQSASAAVGFLGVGVYEELLFRLILLSATAWAFRRAELSPRASAIVAAIVVSLLFAAAHHVGPNHEPFTVSAFAFRTIAGLFFSAVFFYRGFGIAAGSHAAYDIIVGVF